MKRIKVLLKDGTEEKLTRRTEKESVIGTILRSGKVVSLNISPTLNVLSQKNIQVI